MSKNESNKSILLVDDDDLILRSLKVAFNILGYEVICAIDEKTAIEIYQKRSNEIKCLVLDKSISEENQILNKLKDINENCVVLMMSGNFSMEDKIKLKEAGVKGLFNKPFSIHDLAKSIEALGVT